MTKKILSKVIVVFVIFLLSGVGIASADCTADYVTTSDGKKIIEGKVFIKKSLYHKIGDHPSVIGVHPGAIGVENPYDLDINIILTFVIHAERFGASFPFIVTGTNTDWIDMPPIIFRLGMNLGVPVNLAC